ncbi:translation initiation factor Sui1 [Polaromonas sp.]|jgi:translation initiation factor 1|uniref:translation initiation factor Sui1 n=1 Tax=Polaromonas sp. TaxID=1869339 RepID=UPI002C9F8D67|nr:translation initiation factor Sui1 [Polaromonas sp.]HQS32436.1 translation initiation factor Sui1 [Polaromonas sp.]HQS91705.1 translation initiation factor Sui1 [Polaromonas sp.]
MTNPPSSSRLVYSTDAGTMCPECRQPVKACRCKKGAARAASDGVVRVSRQTRGRGGKTVTRVEGLPLDDVALAQLGKQLRSACGSGGTVKEGVVEVQGDHCDKVIETLKQHGHAARRSGG